MIFPGSGAGILAFFDLAVVDRHDGIDIEKLAQRGNGRKAKISHSTCPLSTIALCFASV